MGGAGFSQGLADGLQQAQNRQLQMQQLKLQQDLAKYQQKHMETQDQIQQLNMQSLQQKMADEMQQRQQKNALPGMQADVLGAPMGPGDFGPQPEIDRHKLTSFLTAAQQAGEDPDKILSLMSMGDPRIAAIRDSLTPSKPVQLGEGETLVSPRTGKTIAKGTPKAHAVAAGGSLIQEGQPTVTVPTAPPKPPDYGDRTESAAAVYGQQNYGKPMTFEQLLASDPIEAAKIRQQTMVEEPATIAAGKLKATIPERNAELLTPSEANELGVPFGTTKGEAKGTMPITAHQREALAAYDNSRAIIADIKKYSERVNTAPGGLMGQLSQSTKLWGALTQSDPDAALLQSKAGELANLARALGEKGSLATADIARTAGLVPGWMDSRPVAVQKILDMSDIIDKGEAAYRKSLGIDARAPGKSKGAPPVKPPVQDPLASIPVPKGLTPQQETLWRETYNQQKQSTQQKMKPQTAKKP